MKVFASVGPVLMLMLSLVGVTGCTPPNQSASPPAFTVTQGVGYLVLNAPILPATRDLFIADIEKFRANGAKEIDLGINSPGGDIDSARAMVDCLNREHSQNGIKFKAVNLGLVASAASYLFLNAQDRYTLPKSAFVFHAASFNGNGPQTAEALREHAQKLDAFAQAMRQSLATRTKIADSEASVYLQRTVVLNADDARRDGVVDGITPAFLPNGAKMVMIAAKPNPQAKRPAAQGL